MGFICLCIFYKYIICDIFFSIGSTNLYLGLPDGKSVMPDMCKGKCFVYRIIFCAFSYCSNVYFFIFVFYTNDFLYDHYH